MHAHERLTAEEKLRLLVEFGTRISSELHLDKLLDIIAQQLRKCWTWVVARFI